MLYTVYGIQYTIYGISDMYRRKRKISLTGKMFYSLHHPVDIDIKLDESRKRCFNDVFRQNILKFCSRLDSEFLHNHNTCSLLVKPSHCVRFENLADMDFKPDPDSEKPSAIEFNFYRTVWEALVILGRFSE